MSRPRKDILKERLRVGRARVRRAIDRWFPAAIGEVKTGTVEELPDIVEDVLVSLRRKDTVRDADGRPVERPVDLTLGAMVPRAGGKGPRARYLDRVALVSEDEVHRRQTPEGRAMVARAQAAQLRALDMRADIEVPDGLRPKALPERQGVIGTEFIGGLPAVEASRDLVPTKARGLGLDVGQFQRLVRGSPALADSVAQRTNLMCGATWEYGVPSEIEELAETHPQTLRELGVDIDEVRRHTDELNIELALNPNLDLHQTRVEQVRGGDIVGFAVHEWGLDPNAPLARRLQYIEQRAGSSLNEWLLGPHQELLGFTQEPLSEAPAGQARGYGTPAIDIRRCLYFASEREGANYEGFSRVRPAVFWRKLGNEYAKASLLHMQRFGRGVPVIRRPSDSVQDQKALEASKRAAKNFYNSNNSFFDAPAGFDIEILQVQAHEGLVPLLEYCDTMARTAFGAGVFDIGLYGGGSYALSHVVSQLVLQSLRGFAKGPERAYGALARGYIDAVHGPQLVYPVLKISGILTRSPEESITVWEGVKRIEASNPDMSLSERNGLRAEAGLPPVEVEAEEMAEEEGTEPKASAAEDTTEPGETPDTDAAGEEDTADTEDDATSPAAPRSRAAAPKCTHGKGCRCLKGKKPSPARPRAKVRVIDRVGEFVTHRELTVLEATCVDFRAVDRLIESAKVDGVSAIHSAASTLAREYIALALPLIDAGSMADIAALEFGSPEPLRQALYNYYSEIADEAQEQMLLELRQQVPGEWDVVEQGDAEVEEIIRASAIAASRAIADNLSQRLRAAAMAVMQGAGEDLLWDVEPTERFAGGQIQAGAITVIGEAREHAAMALGPEIAEVQYSAVLDVVTCEECESVDGNMYEVDSPEWAEVRPPNRRCYGELSGRPACRCLGVYVTRRWRDDNPVTETADGLPAPPPPLVAESG